MEAAEQTAPGPRRFGDYELLDEIARGGMGVVYRARQVKLNRIVALKMILGGQLAGSEEVKRFRQEAEAAAQLKHPNIVAIHEVGEHDGQHFFSMDFIEGQTLRQLTRDNPLPAPRAAAYLKTIAEAVHYAHERGVVHRDLKPSNVLIDAAGEPHVTDFGLAKRIGSEAENLTVSGAAMGTPGYMPPEQASGGSKTVGPLADVYALGAMLYDLLTGRPPFRAETPLETMAQAVSKEPVAPRLLNASVPRDLETICLKCLEKEPSRRYASARELADELGRFLRDEPIRARPVGQTEKLWRWGRRNRALATAVTAALALLLTVAIGSPIAAWRINRERGKAETARQNEAGLRVLAQGESKRARDEADKSKQISRFLEQMLRGVEPSVAAGRDTTMLREILDKTAERVGRDFPRQPEVQFDLQDTLIETYRQLRLYPQMEAMARDNLRLGRLLYGEQHADIAKSLLELAIARLYQNDPAEAERLDLEALGMQRKLLPPDHHDIANTLNNLGRVCHERGEFTNALAYGQEALAMQTRLFGDRSLDTARSQQNLAHVLQELGQLTEAEALCRQSLASRRHLLPESHIEVAGCLGRLAAILAAQGQLDEAEQLQREALDTLNLLMGPEHEDVAHSLINRADILAKQRRFTEAEPLYRNGLNLLRKLRGNKQRDVAVAMGLLADAVRSLGRPAESETLYLEALAIQRELLGDEHLDVASLLNQLGCVLWDQKRLAEAKPVLSEALVIRRQRLGPEHKLIATSLNNLGQVLTGLGSPGEAEAFEREALAMQKNLLGDEHSDIAFSLANIGRACKRQGKLGEAETAYRQALAMRERLHEPVSPDLADMLGDLGALYWDTRRPADAEAMHRKALEIRRKIQPDHPSLATSLNNLGVALQRLGRLDQADAFLTEAVTFCRKYFGDKASPTLESLATLAMLRADQSRLPEAERLEREVWQGRQQTPGAESLALADACNNLGITLWKRKKYTEAEGLHRQALALREKLGGASHPDVARSLNNLGAALREQGKLDDAEPLFHKALAINRSRFPDDPTRWERNLENIVDVCRRGRRFDEIDRLFQEVLTPAITRQPASASLLTVRADDLARRGRWADAAATTAQVMKLEPGNQRYFHDLAPLLAAAGNANDYARQCQQAIARFASTNQPLIPRRFAKECLLLPVPGLDLPALRRMAEIVDPAQTNRSSAFTQGLAAYRQGRFAEAAAVMRQILAPAGKPLDDGRETQALAVLTLALAQLQQTEEARETLARADAARAKLPALGRMDLGPDWREWITAQILLREARATLDGNVSGPLAPLMSE